ncbi:hypothetical protein CCP3SC15_3210002 [Gammaproteobacteria bacterium]
MLAAAPFLPISGLGQGGKHCQLPEGGNPVTFEEGVSDARPARGTSAAGVGPLPCLSSHKCTEEGFESLSPEVQAQWNKLTGSHKKVAECLRQEIICLTRTYGVNRLVFVTLTFEDNCTDRKEAQRRFRRLCRGLLSKIFAKAIVVIERQARGAIHYHLVGVVDFDAKTGFDFEAQDSVYAAEKRCRETHTWFRDDPAWQEATRRRNNSGSEELRALWAQFRQDLKEYQFGRHEILPIRSNADGISKYVAKYVSKNVGSRKEEDKGAHLVRYLNYKSGDRHWKANFAWGGRQDPEKKKGTPAPCNPLAEATVPNDRAWLWRQKVGAWAEAQCMSSTDQIKELCGPRWAFHFKDEIFGTELGDVQYPSEEAARLANEESLLRIVRRVDAFNVQQSKGTACGTLLGGSNGGLRPLTPEQEKRQTLREVVDEFEENDLKERYCALNHHPHGLITEPGFRSIYEEPDEQPF